ncbi:MAG: preprotein translocase subunit SecE [Lachnospiraceae bacterium]|nr:preprotein translocase subunit SecE [Lachnospiraceae bacterium]
MGETENTSKAPKENWFAGLKAEFKKIIWPTKESLAKQTAAVVIVSVVVGLIITVMDFFIQHGVDILVNL